MFTFFINLKEYYLLKQHLPVILFFSLFSDDTKARFRYGHDNKTSKDSKRSLHHTDGCTENKY